MNTSPVEAALAQVLQEMLEMDPQQLRAELDAHSTGNMVVVLSEAQEFLVDSSQ